MKSYVEEFYRQYEQPSVGKLVVGFSGIDPARKSLTDVEPSELTDDQLEIFRQMMLGYMSSLKIRIDSGNVDPKADEPETPYINLRPSDIPHENLGGLLGGNTEGHYHLTDRELMQLLKLVHALMPEGEEVEFPDMSNHEELSSLFGGNKAGHYHLTNEQLVKLSKLLKLFYPNDEPDPVIPSTPDPVPTPDPEPDNPDPKPEPEPEPDEPYGGLPKGTPPNWLPQSFPKNYGAWAGTYKMYYGDMPYKNTSTTPNVLLVPMKYQNQTTLWLRRTTDGENWSAEKSWQSTSGTNIDDYLLTVDSKGVYRLFVVRSPNTSKSLYYIYSKASSGSTTSNSTGAAPTTVTPPYTAGCYSPLLDISIFVTQSGSVIRVQGITIEKTMYEAGVPVNPGCAAWSPEHCVFCVCGANGTATSATGQTWAQHTNAPKNLVDLTWREDLGCFFARSYTNKMFYVSGDGATWNRLNNTPIPIEEVTCVDYSPELGWYCAIGGTNRTVYFSKDLEHWIETTITNGVELEMNSVKYIPGVGKYILMPKSGSYYYTFDVSSWQDA